MVNRHKSVGCRRKQCGHGLGATGALALVALLVVLSGAGCSTQRFKSTHPADIVASRIADGWEGCAASGRLPVVRERQGEVYFVGVPSFSALNWLPSSTRHPTYPVWVEVTNTESGSGTTYRRAYQIFHGKLDKVVIDSQK